MALYVLCVLHTHVRPDALHATRHTEPKDNEALTEAWEMMGIIMLRLDGLDLD
jgi:hypothetical protein